ncbi:MAG: hypothetical protein J1F23_04780 [Oscillospiraceae bacterium]|nr:hypothetical protein [Oscillospiraceae bacterium]
MNKKIIAVAVLLLAFVVIFAACKKDKPDDSKADDPSNGELQVSVDDNGDLYVTNVDGDKIPVTTDEDGFYDDISTLVTATTNPNAGKNDEKTPPSNNENSSSQPTGNVQPTGNGQQTGNEQPTDNGQDKPNGDDPTENTEPTGGGVEIGSGSGGGSISWDEIPAKDD